MLTVLQTFVAYLLCFFFGRSNKLKAGYNGTKHYAWDCAGGIGFYRSTTKIEQGIDIGINYQLGSDDIYRTSGDWEGPFLALRRVQLFGVLIFVSVSATPKVLSGL